MKTLEQEICILKEIWNSNNPNKEAEFQAKVNEINRNYPSEEDADKMADFVLECYKKIGSDLEVIANEISIRQQLSEVKEVVSLAYIARKYFGKSKQWLNNRINGCIVNGKPCKFTEEEKEKLNYAFSDLGNFLGSIRIL